MGNGISGCCDLCAKVNEPESSNKETIRSTRATLNGGSMTSLVYLDYFCRLFCYEKDFTIAK